MDDDQELRDLETKVFHEIRSAITNYESDSVIEDEIQPPSSIIDAAARAAAAVLIAFERGVRHIEST